VDEYEFDPVLRAMLEKNVMELTEATRKNIGRTILEYSKVARQRAATGARLRVIRQLTGMPAAFEKSDAMKPMVFTRIVQNTSYILNTPEGRAMATAQALGVDMSTLFGGRKMLDNASGEPQGKTDNEPPADDPPESPAQGKTAADLVAEAAATDDPDFPDEPTGPGPGSPPQEKTEFDRLTDSLREFLDGYKTELNVTTSSGRNPYKLAQEELSSLIATEETRGAMIRRLRAYLKEKGINV
jgi:hypothetical protein